MTTGTGAENHISLLVVQFPLHLYLHPECGPLSFSPPLPNVSLCFRMYYYFQDKQGQSQC